MAPKIVGLIFLTSLLAISSSQEPLSFKENSQSSCEEVCENTYPLHTYEKATHAGCCKRGCRLFTIIDFIEEFSDVNTTQESCAISCKDAYNEVDEKDACVVGCNSQAPCYANRYPGMEQLFDPASQNDAFYPLMYVHNMYSNMFTKLHDTMSVSWSFYIQGNNGQLVVIQAASPRLIDITGQTDDEYKTSNYLETNLEALDNSATPNFKHSQMHALERDLGGQEISLGEEQPADFLGCIARKTGLPKLLLSVTIFLSALVMIWLCISSAVTAPDQHIRAAPPQKLSIYGDLEYLRETSDKDKAWLLASIRPQDCSIQAAPLPIKIKVGVV